MDANRWLKARNEEDEQRRQAGLEYIKEASRRQFVRDCYRDGIDPKRGVSSALLATLRGQSC